MPRVKKENKSDFKVCRDCNFVLFKEDGFYKGGRGSYQTRCKKCHSAYTARMKKINNPNITTRECTWFDALDSHLIRQIMDDLNNKMKVKTTARKYGLSYHCLLYYVNKGKFDIYDQ